MLLEDTLSIPNFPGLRCKLRHLAWFSGLSRSHMFRCRVKIIVLSKGSGYGQFLKNPFNGTAYLFEILVQNRVKLLRKFTICEGCHWAMRHYVDRRRLNGGHVTDVVEDRG
jgi:hypothetical protein